MRTADAFNKLAIVESRSPNCCHLRVRGNWCARLGNGEAQLRPHALEWIILRSAQEMTRVTCLSRCPAFLRRRWRDNRRQGRRASASDRECRRICRKYDAEWDVTCNSRRFELRYRHRRKLLQYCATIAWAEVDRVFDRVGNGWCDRK